MYICTYVHTRSYLPYLGMPYTTQLVIVLYDATLRNFCSLCTNTQHELFRFALVVVRNDDSDLTSAFVIPVI